MIAPGRRTRLNAELSQPSDHLRVLAQRIALIERRRMFRRWTELFDRPADTFDKVTLGFTLICNRCGSIRVGVVEVYRGGEYAGWDMRCDDCVAEAKKEAAAAKKEGGS